MIFMHVKLIHRPYGYVQGKSCLANLLDLFEEATKVIDKNGVMNGVDIVSYLTEFLMVGRSRRLGCIGSTVNW